jgi:hypothetical protein
VPFLSHFQETAVRWSFDFLGCFEKKSSKTFALDCILTALVTFSPKHFFQKWMFSTFHLLSFWMLPKSESGKS